MFEDLTFDSRSMSLSDVTVPTTETVSVSFWAGMLIEVSHHAKVNI